MEIGDWVLYTGAHTYRTEDMVGSVGRVIEWKKDNVLNVEWLIQPCGASHSGEWAVFSENVELFQPK